MVVGVDTQSGQSVPRRVTMEDKQEHVLAPNQRLLMVEMPAQETRRKYVLVTLTNVHVMKT
jgi:hypothetical protein